MSPTIAIAGVTGFTGQLIATELIHRGIPFQIIGRNREKLFEWQKINHHTGEVIETDIFSESSLGQSLKDIDLLVNCIGPYNLYSKAICEAAIYQGKGYMDLTGEQSFVRHFHTGEYQKLAEENKACIVHSLAFESFLADLMVGSKTDENETVQEVSSFYYFSRSRPSPGTRLTMQTVEYFPTWAVKKHQYLSTRPLEWSRGIRINSLPEVRYAQFMPYPEVIFYNERFQPTCSGSFILTEDDLSLLRPRQENPDMERLHQLVEKHQKRTFSPLTLDERKSQKFKLFTRFVRSNGEAEVASLEGADPYAITSTIMVESVIRFLEQGKSTPGIQSPASFFGTNEILKKICTTHQLMFQTGVDHLEILVPDT